MSVPEGTNAGTYYVWYKVVGDDNHNDSTPANVAVTIAPKSITGATVTLDRTQLTYNGSQQSVAVTGVMVDNLTLTENDYTVTGNTGTDKNTYTVTVTGKGNFNGTVTAQWKIVEKAMTVTAQNASVTYDGQPRGIAVSVTDPASGATVQYGRTEGTCDLTVSPTITNVSESPLTVYFKVSAANYIDYEGSAVVTIAKATGADFAAPTANTPTYTGGDRPLVTAPASVPAGYTVQYSLDGTTYEEEIPTGKDAGDYTVKVKYVPDANHNDVDGTEVKVNIARATATPTAYTANVLTYNGGDQPLVTAPTSVLTGYTVQYSLDGKNYTDEIPTGREAGNYTVKVKYVADANHDDVDGADVKVTIAKKALTVTANDQTKRAGEQDPELTYVPEGLVGSDKLTGALSRVAGEEVGTYDITVGDLKATDDYELKFVGAKLTISTAEEGHVEVAVQTDKDVPKTEVKGVTKALAQSLATDDEKERIENGENMKLTLEITNIEETVSEEDKATVAKEMGEGDNVAMYLDISMFKQVGDDAPEKVTELDGKTVTVTLTIPEEQRKEGRIFHIVQIHDGKPIVYGPFTGDTITLNLKDFSTFVLTYTDAPRSTPVKKIKLTGGNRTIRIGETLDLSGAVVLTPKDATMTLKWRSANKKIATVDKYGVVTGEKKGTTTITVTTANNKTAKVTVKVTGIAPKSVKLTGGTRTIRVGEELELGKAVQLTPQKATSPLKWKSSKPTIADVDENGVVKGLKPGAATITVTTSNNRTAKLKVKVVRVSAKNVRFKLNEMKLASGQSLNLEDYVVLTPRDATTTFKWKSSKPKIASVDKNGVLKGKKEGKTTITVTTNNGKKAKADVIVENKTVIIEVRYDESYAELAENAMIEEVAEIAGE